MTTITIFQLTSSIIVALVSLLIPLKSPELKWIRIYCIVNALAEIIGDILALKSINNILLIYSVILIELYVLIRFFKSISAKINAIPNKWLYLTIYLLFFTVAVLLENPFEFNPYSLIFEGVFIFLCAIIYFVEQLQFPKVPFIHTKPDFWFVSGFILYYGGTWLIFAGTQLFVIKQELFVYIWDGHNMLSILKNVAIIIGLIYSR